MSDKNVKELRKQLRIIVQEILPEVLTNELVATLSKQVTAKLEQRLDGISAHLIQAIKTIDDRSKDVQAYIIRNSSVPNPAVISPPVPENTPSATLEG